MHLDIPDFDIISLDSRYFYFVLSKVEAAQHLIDQMDVNKDGKVSFPEFLIVMKHGNPVGSMKPQDSSEANEAKAEAEAEAGRRMSQASNSELHTYIHQQGALRIQ